MPIYADLEVQLGQEATNAWGTAVNPTVVLAGVQDVSINPLVDVSQVEEMDGTRIPSRKSLVNMVGGEGSISSLLSYDDLPYWLQGMFGKVTATSDASGWLHSYQAPHESSDTEDAISFTLLETDGTNSHTLNGATVNSISITGESGAPLEISVDFIGQNVTTDVKAALSPRSVTYVMGDHVQLFIDSDGGAFGTTATSDIGWSFDLSVEMNRDVKRHLNDLTPTGYREAKPTGTLGLSVEHDAVVESNIVEILGATAEGIGKNVRLYAVDTNGYAFTVDFAGVLSGSPAIFQDVDGVVSADLELMGQLNSGSTNWLFMSVINGTETLV